MLNRKDPLGLSDAGPKWIQLTGKLSFYLSFRHVDANIIVVVVGRRRLAARGRLEGS